MTNSSQKRRGDMTVQFYGYTIHTNGTLRKAQMILAQAEREVESGDIDRWYHAGCPVGRAYRKYERSTR